MIQPHTSENENNNNNNNLENEKQPNGFSTLPFDPAAEPVGGGGDGGPGAGVGAVDVPL